MAATDKPVSHTKFEVLKAIPRGHVTTDRGTWTWRHTDGYVVTSTMRALIEDGLVMVAPEPVDGRRIPRVTQAGYAELSRAAHAYTGKKAKKR